MMNTKNMKKIVSITMIIAGALLIIANAIAYGRHGIAVSVIGGADGPTSVFVAGRISSGSIISAAVVGVLVVGMGIFLLYRTMRKS